MSPPAKARMLWLMPALALAGCAGSSDRVAAAGEQPHRAPHLAHSKTVEPPEPTIGGAVMRPDQTIAANAAAAPTLTIFMQTVKAAGLEQALSGAGPYTLFAPTNEAYGRLASGTVDALLKPENKASLVKLIEYGLVPGVITADDLRARVRAGNGTATLTTLEGDPLTVTMTGDVITLHDVNGNRSYIQTSDVRQSNGMIHVINGMLIPNLA
ncbi:MAG: fasciclin domain-containing protein [Sphingomonas sp.]